MHTGCEKEFIIPVALHNFEHGTICFMQPYRKSQ